MNIACAGGHFQGKGNAAASAGGRKFLQFFADAPDTGLRRFFDTDSGFFDMQPFKDLPADPIAQNARSREHE